MKKSDHRLQHDIEAELESEPRLRHSEIGVRVRNGIVTLTGCTASYMEKLAAEKAVRRVAGVRAIAEEIEVRVPANRANMDHEIARHILDIFAWNVMIPEGEIELKVEHGHVTLSGEADWAYQRDAAASAASQVDGVTAVSNQIALRQRPSAFDVRERIQAAIRRQSHHEANAITVETDGGTVFLRGRCEGFADRQIAEEAAWAAPGVTHVIDETIMTD